MGQFIKENTGVIDLSVTNINICHTAIENLLNFIGQSLGHKS